MCGGIGSYLSALPSSTSRISARMAISAFTKRSSSACMDRQTRHASADHRLLEQHPLPLQLDYGPQIHSTRQAQGSLTMMRPQAALVTVATHRYACTKPLTRLH